MLVLEFQSFIMNHHNLVFKKKNKSEILKLIIIPIYWNRSPENLFKKIIHISIIHRKLIYAYIYIVFVKIFKLNIWNSNEIYNKTVFHFHVWLIFFNKNNTFIYKYAYTRIKNRNNKNGTTRWQQTFNYKINDNLFFLPFMMTIFKFFLHIIQLIKWIL